MSRRNSIPGQFAWRLVEMLESSAYRALSHSAHRLLARLEIELAHHGGQQNGKLPLTYEQIVAYGIHRHSIAPAIRETVALGFVEVTERGRAANAEFRSPSKYRLTYRHVGRANPTDEWRRIKTDDEAEMIAKGARRQGSNSTMQLRQRPAPRRRANGSRKHFPGDGSRQFSVSKTITENDNSPVTDSVTTVPVSETITTIDISGGGGERRRLYPEAAASSTYTSIGASGQYGMAMAALSELCLPLAGQLSPGGARRRGAQAEQPRSAPS